MLVKDVKSFARRWVQEQGRLTPGFLGAYIAGSATTMADDAPYPPTSDLDMMLVLQDPGDAIKPGKFLYHGALLEASYLSRDALRDPQEVLASPHLAGGFRTNSILLDPTGLLTALYQAVSLQFTRRHWVRARCEQAAEQVRRGASSLNPARPLHDQVSQVAFTAGITTFVLLCAGLQNPTVRKRYVAARDLLERYGRLDFHQPLLALSGYATLSRPQVERHLEGMTAAFDAASRARRTPYRFGSDISAPARPISVDGTRELIEQGLHREAVFWIVATYGRSRHILSVDAPDLLPTLDRTYLPLLSDLGIASFDQRQRRCAEIEAFLPAVWSVAQEIMAANSAIQA